MKVSELIAELQKAMAEHGDIEVRFYGSGISIPIEYWETEKSPDYHGGAKYIELCSQGNGPIW